MARKKEDDDAPEPGEVAEAAARSIVERDVATSKTGDRIEVTRPGKAHCDDGMNNVEVPPGEYAVADAPTNIAEGIVSLRCASVFLQNGWAQDADGENPTD